MSLGPAELAVDEPEFRLHGRATAVVVARSVVPVSDSKCQVRPAGLRTSCAASQRSPARATTMPAAAVTYSTQVGGSTVPGTIGRFAPSAGSQWKRIAAGTAPAAISSRQNPASSVRLSRAGRFTTCSSLREDGP